MNPISKANGMVEVLWSDNLLLKCVMVYLVYPGLGQSDFIEVLIFKCI